jgi:hypothetical protein
MAKRLDPEILARLNAKTGKAITTLRKDISLVKRDYPNATSNAAAQIVAQNHGTSVLQRLDPQDRASLRDYPGRAPVRGPSGRTAKPRTPATTNRAQLFDYETSEYFKLEHIRELNRANSANCHTCVFVLFRKILENLLIDILRAKFPGKAKDQIELYYNTVQRRYRDFSEILESLKQKRRDFGIDGEKVIERLVQLVKPFKSDANDKAHSWFHVVKSQREIQDTPIEAIVELVKKLETIVGLRARKPAV